MASNSFLSNTIKKPYMCFKYFYSNFIAGKNIDELNKYIDKGLNIIWYLDVPTHSNMGDLAQYVCIKDWLVSNYPEYTIAEISADTIVNAEQKFIDLLKNKKSNGDLIFFQSGYCTQDLGGFHDYVHQLVIRNFPSIPIIMLPQTILYKNRENAEAVSNNYRQHKKILLLCRDYVSYSVGEKMFENNKLLLYPDIVTSLIGTLPINDKKDRSGILICCRNDSEKYYDENTIKMLSKKLGKIDDVTISDTTVACDFSKLKSHIKERVQQMINDFGRYRVVITDRYHGTIFSLIAGTPVIVIKSNDHKVITGVDWFKGIYDQTVCYVDNIYNVYEKVTYIYNNYDYVQLNSVFRDTYYANLKNVISECIKEK
ncbi:polysaccharide pyruvyl transferase family protein [Clostridium sp. AWRP]|uniref:polysaccharide pyruvyl transferase family protein n=1 Tax=Clostridium sp. AWRP TaxID=2212991 RepID=UPI0015867937|nr:polysaccharide pyruvyl transferase family protein [Clostridium sp. AWRP]